MVGQYIPGTAEGQFQKRLTRGFLKSDYAPVIRNPLIRKVSDTGDHHRAMALSFRPVDSSLLCLAPVELAVSRVFDDVMGDRGMRIAAFGARFNVNLGHLFYPFGCVVPRHAVRRGKVTLPGRSDIGSSRWEECEICLALCHQLITA